MSTTMACVQTLVIFIDRVRFRVQVITQIPRTSSAGFETPRKEFAERFLAHVPVAELANIGKE